RAPSPLYTFTRICSVGYIRRMESVFEIIAEPNRRAILSLLVSSQQSVGEVERQLRMPQPTVSKHLRVLREAGFVESTVDAQRRLYRLKPEPLQEVDAWLALTDPAHLREWAPFDVDGSLGTVGTVKLTWVGTPTPLETRVTRADAPKVLEYNDTRWELEAFGGGTRLTLWHNIDRRFIS